MSINVNFCGLSGIHKQDTSSQAKVKTSTIVSDSDSKAGNISQKGLELLGRMLVKPKDVTEQKSTKETSGYAEARTRYYELSQEAVKIKEFEKSGYTIGEDGLIHDKYGYPCDYKSAVISSHDNGVTKIVKYENGKPVTVITKTEKNFYSKFEVKDYDYTKSSYDTYVKISGGECYIGNTPRGNNIPEQIIDESKPL